MELRVSLHIPTSPSSRPGSWKLPGEGGKVSRFGNKLLVPLIDFPVLPEAPAAYPADAALFPKGIKSEQGLQCPAYIQRAQHTRLLLERISQIPGSIQPSGDAESNCHKENRTAHETLVCAMLYASHLRLLTAFTPPNHPG